MPQAAHFSFSYFLANLSETSDHRGFPRLDALDSDKAPSLDGGYRTWTLKPDLGLAKPIRLTSASLLSSESSASIQSELMRRAPKKQIRTIVRVAGYQGGLRSIRGVTLNTDFLAVNNRNRLELVRNTNPVGSSIRLPRIIQGTEQEENFVPFIGGSGCQPDTRGTLIVLLPDVYVTLPKTFWMRIRDGKDRLDKV
ncbi:hypothetical protein BDP67DRAFT_487366 [Colletotrichum lupini]|nr:hypothetical protein BDP67DRAFT_487366 [Colletotrichum lupini]